MLQQQHCFYLFFQRQCRDQGEVYDRLFTSVTVEQQRYEKGKFGMYMPEIMGRNPYLNTVIVNLLHAIDFRLFVGEQQVFMNHENIEDFQVELNMATGLLTRKFKVNTENGGILTACYDQ